MPPVAFAVTGSGPPLLLIAGTAFSGSTWPPAMVTRLALRYRVISFDHRGTGLTPSGPGAYSTRQFAHDALLLLDHLGVGLCHVLGHSMGGRVAQWLALDAPERVASLVLAASGPGRYRDDQPVVTGVPLEVALGLGTKGYKGYILEHLRSTFFTPEAMHSPAARWLLRTYWRTRPDLEDYLKHTVARQQHLTTARLPEITQPTLVLVGDRDTHPGGTGSHLEQSRYLAEHLPNSELAVLPGQAHGYFWQATEEALGPILSWLRGRS